MAEQSQLLLILTGPESTGKSTLAAVLAEALAAPLVTEQARSYLETRSASAGEYTEQDVLAIAQAQAQVEGAALARQSPVVVADTDQQVLRLWWQEKFGELPEELQALQKSAPGLEAGIRRHYLLCYPDLAWEPDPLRENPNDRLRLFQRQLAMLESEQALFRVIWGLGPVRERRAWEYLKTLLPQ